VRSRASSFKWEYPLLSLRSSSSFLHLLPRLPVTSIPPFIFPSITCCRRQFLHKMWPIQLALKRSSMGNAPQWVNFSFLKILLTKNVHYIQKKLNSDAITWNRASALKNTHGLMFMFYQPWIKKKVLCKWCKNIFDSHVLFHFILFYYYLFLKLHERPMINHLTPNIHFSGRTAPLTYRCCIFLFIQQIYVLNILNMLHTLRLFLFKMSFTS
jgi:hypothetical protein